MLMKKISNKFDKRKIGVALAILTFLFLIIMSLEYHVIKLSFASDFFNLVSSGFRKNVSRSSEEIWGVLNYKGTLEEVSKLKEENAKFKEQFIKEKLSKNELEELRELKKSLNYLEEDYKKHYISASVVAKNEGNFYESFTISAGKNDGVKKNGIILSGEGLVGKVEEVSDDYSKCISALNYKSAVSFEILRNPDFLGVLKQSMILETKENYDGYMIGYMMDIKDDVLPKDILITSGYGMYPKGIPVGEIRKVEKDKNALVKYIKVKPYANFKKLDKVMIINPRIID